MTIVSLKRVLLTMSNFLWQLQILWFYNCIERQRELTSIDPSWILSAMAFLKILHIQILCTSISENSNQISIKHILRIKKSHKIMYSSKLIIVVHDKLSDLLNMIKEICKNYVHHNRPPSLILLNYCQKRTKKQIQI